MVRLVSMVIIIILTVFLTGCGNEEKKLVEEAKKDFRVVYDYEEDKLRPVIDEEMTEEELARKYLLTRLDLEEDEPIFKERGVLQGQGIFVESAIYDGASIPNVSPMSEETKEFLKGNREDKSEARKAEEFERLAENRKQFLDEQYKTDNTGLQEVEDAIKRQLIEMEQDQTELHEIEYED